jgi:putative hydrolase of the HAD superfamily
MELKRRGKRLGVFSNDRAAGLALTLAQMEIRGYFEYVETSEAIGIEKPDPRAFDHILDHFKVPPSRLTYVGDDPIGDIDAAKAKGIRAVLHAVDGRTYKQPWRDYGRVGATQPDAIIRHFRELLDVIA